LGGGGGGVWKQCNVEGQRRKRKKLHETKFAVSDDNGVYCHQIYPIDDQETNVFHEKKKILYMFLIKTYVVTSFGRGDTFPAISASGKSGNFPSPQGLTSPVDDTIYG
jgi:hypothetical protein